MTWLLRSVVAVSLGAALSVIAAVPAHASCIATPLPSPYRFTGTVARVDNAGRTATVRTDDGRMVVVRGSDADEPNAATSVDRTYQPGVRYEFHPLNDTSPYRDNACTATHRIAATSVGAGGVAEPDHASGGTAGKADAPGPARWPWLGGLGVLVLASAGALLFRRRVRGRERVVA